MVEFLTSAPRTTARHQCEKPFSDRRYIPGSFGASSVLKGMDLARKYPEYIHVDYSHMLRPNMGERFYFFHEGWLWNWAPHYCVHLFAR